MLSASSFLTISFTVSVLIRYSYSSELLVIMGPTRTLKSGT